MAIKAKFPIRVMFWVNKKDDAISVSVRVKYDASIEEYPSVSARQSKEITLAPEDEKAIIKFCKDVILPQL